MVSARLSSLFDCCCPPAGSRSLHVVSARALSLIDCCCPPTGSRSLHVASARLSSLFDCCCSASAMKLICLCNRGSVVKHKIYIAPSSQLNSIYYSQIKFHYLENFHIFQLHSSLFLSAKTSDFLRSVSRKTRQFLHFQTWFLFCLHLGIVLGCQWLPSGSEIIGYCLKPQFLELKWKMQLQYTKNYIPVCVLLFLHKTN